MTIRVVLQNGYEEFLKCENYKVIYNKETHQVDDVILNRDVSILSIFPMNPNDIKIVERVS